MDIRTLFGIDNRSPLSDCFPPDDSESPVGSPKIAGGHDAPEGRFPYMVSLRTHEDEHTCGGILIHERFVLTAAHCVDENSGVAGRNRLAHIGAYGIDDNEDQGVQTVRIDKTTIHPNYTAGHLKGGYDVALLHLKHPAHGIAIPGLADPHLILHCQMTLYTLGWGYLDSWHSSLPDKLQMSTRGQIIWGRPPCAVDGHLLLCLKAPESYLDNTCQGDSGGPALIPDMPGGDFQSGSPKKDLIVAVTSYGPKCSRPEKIGYYTRLSAMRNWIDEVIEPRRQ
ncbi:unnamed protein product [Ostreobium quekettii]|uniref:Peptidase S1 domain-containing protein n=1 Tax=Ostreobium quekettii TaxID=121088 RepID=A0A8S1INA0_9CHLO|nr:unnamed protein product [Ostreobium quekettii]